MSLKDKLRTHYDKGKREDPINFKLPCPELTPLMMHRWMPVISLTVATVVWIWGEFITLPYLYSNSIWLRFHTTFANFIFFELLLNWFFIWYVDTTYKPSVHGAQPSSEPLPVSNSGSTSRMASTGNDKLRKEKLKENGEMREKRPDEHVIYVATSFPGEGDKSDRIPYRYWSWTPCLLCRRPRPPRCHHCNICNKCVLKRDHHCFFARTCIGLHNQRHFVVFTFWAMIATSYGFVNGVVYIYMAFLQDMSYIDFIPFVGFLRMPWSGNSLSAPMLVLLAWTLGIFLWLSTSFSKNNIKSLRTSQTTFEEIHKIKIIDTRSKHERIKELFGDYWLVNFIIPLHWKFEPTEDAVNWSHIKQT